MSFMELLQVMPTLSLELPFSRMLTARLFTSLSKLETLGLLRNTLAHSVTQAHCGLLNSRNRLTSKTRTMANSTWNCLTSNISSTASPSLTTRSTRIPLAPKSKEQVMSGTTIWMCQRTRKCFLLQMQ